MKKKTEKFDIKMLMRYLKGKATSEDPRIVKRRLANSDLEHDFYEESLRFWDETPLDPNIYHPTQKFMPLMAQEQTFIFLMAQQGG